MSDLLAILSQGAASLAAQRAAVATASHNLQNANTPGYARQRAVIAATLPADRTGTAFIGRGAVLQAISQSRDRFLEAQLPALLGSSARSSAQASTLAAVSALDPEAAGGVGESLSGFWSAIRAAAQSPADAGLRASAISAARTLALSLQRTRASLEGARGGVDARVSAATTEVNDLAAQVAQLNGQIRTARVSGGEPNDLLDARQKAVDRLAALTGVSPVGTSEGDVSLFLPGGAALVSGLEASRLSTIADVANDGHLQVQLSGPRGGAQAFTGLGGELGGALDARDGALRAAVTGLDALAFDLGNAVNGVHRAGFGLDGTTGDDLFTVGVQAGAAARIDVGAALLADPRRFAAAGAATGPTSAAPGDAANLKALLLQVENAPLAGSGLSATASLAKLTSDLGVAVGHAEAAASQDASLLDHLAALRESVSGVSIDEEMIEMQKAQRAFEAISKVIAASSAMFDTLLQLK